MNTLKKRITYKLLASVVKLLVETVSTSLQVQPRSSLAETVRVVDSNAVEVNLWPFV